ncbi:lactococcin 972 family bacteriocin [Bacillus pseudomycoides]|nr:lactococcin 972 family bacteriocin [Bacillus pseudomycoides]
MRLKKKLSSFVLGAVCVSAFATAVAAERDYVEGGKWDHGYGNGHVYSEYYHDYNDHHSSVKVGSKVFPSGWTEPGEWAKASASYKWYDAIKTYYNIR